MKPRASIVLSLLTAAACSFNGDTERAGASSDGDGAPGIVVDASDDPDALIRPAEIFSGSESDLWRLDPMTLEATFIGDFSNFVEPAPFPCGGLALDSAGTLYAITVGPPSRLYVVDKTTAALSNPVPLGNTDSTWGSTIVPAGTIASTERLVIAGPGGDLRSVDLATGNTSAVGSFGGGWRVSGDLAWVDGVGLMGTVDNGGTDRLATISLSDGSITIVGDTGRSDVYGLTSVGGRVWGLTGSQDIFEMDPGDASELSNLAGPSFWSIAAP
jgi:hypothetical protein